MKINESRLKQIIAEEMAAIEDKQYFDYTDKEGSMAKRQLYNLAQYAIQLHDSLNDEDQLESWVQSKITIASEYIGKVKHYLEYEMGVEMHDLDLMPGEPEDVGGCGHDSEPHGQDAEPLMVVDGEETYEIDDEDAYLMES